MSLLETIGMIILVLIGALVLIGLVAFASSVISDLFNPRAVKKRLAKWFGPGFWEIATHDKTFPGYDLASVSRALECFFEECTTSVSEVGSVPATTMRDLFEQLRGPLAAIQPGTPTFERVPVDVDEEAPFATNMLWLAEVEGDKTERVAILLAASVPEYQDFIGIDGQQSLNMRIWLSVAARSKETAGRVFEALESRRRRCSVFRGKVIDPVVDPGGIRTIGFSNLKTVESDSLILPESVDTLITSSILQFYAHSDTLEALGVDRKRGILFHGVPGTGKTSVCLHLANELEDFTICFVSGQRLLYPRELCRMARYLQPTMIVFEDIDLIAEQRDQNGLATVLGELMNQIDGCEPHEEVLFVMNTNSLERLESAVRNRPGRVDQIIEIPPPDDDNRRALIELFAARTELCVADWPQLIEATRGATPAMLKEIVKRAIVSRIAALDPASSSPSGLELDDRALLLATEQVRMMRGNHPGQAAGIGFRRSSA